MFIIISIIKQQNFFINNTKHVEIICWCYIFHNVAVKICVNIYWNSTMIYLLFNLWWRCSSRIFSFFFSFFLLRHRVFLHCGRFFRGFFNHGRLFRERFFRGPPVVSNLLTTDADVEVDVDVDVDEIEIEIENNTNSDFKIEIKKNKWWSYCINIELWIWICWCWNNHWWCCYNYWKL